MKKTLLFILLLITATVTSYTQASKIFFSEYMEGSSSNKALEIYNGSSATVSLSDFVVYRNNNGSAMPSDSLFPMGALMQDSVYVIGNPSANGTILGESDTTHTLTFYNGDDAIWIKHIPTGDTIDIIGEIGVDPGSGWIVGAGATNNNTLVRNMSVTQGQTDWAIGVTEWGVFPIDMDDSLGFHTQILCENPILNNVFYSPTPACDSLGTTLNIAGLLKDATAWHIYEGSCGGTLVGTTTSLSFVFNPDTTKLYYVRGEGGCVTPSVCDTLTIQVVKIVPAIQVDSNVACFGDSTGGASVTVTGGLAPYRYIWSNGATTPFITGVPAGTYTVNISDANDCFKNRSITIVEPMENRDTLGVVNICAGDSISVFGSFQMTSGYYFDTNQSITGCDSITAQELIVGTVYRDTLSSQMICEGGSVALFGTIESLAGWYTDTSSTVSGCDSILYQELIVNSVYRDTLAIANVCAGDSISIFGTFQLTAGYYYDSLLSVFGCDSIFVQELVVNTVSVSTINDTICRGDSIRINGVWYASAVTFNDTLIAGNSTGCDSVVTHIVHVDTVSPVLNLGSDIATCNHAVVPLTAPLGYASYVWSSGGTTNTENIDGSVYGIGTFNIWLEVVDATTGCNASDTVEVQFYNCVGVEPNDKDVFLVYPNPSVGLINVVFDQKESGVVSVVDVNGSVVYESSINDTTATLLNLTEISKVVYILVVKTKNGTLSKRISIK